MKRRHSVALYVYTAVLRPKQRHLVARGEKIKKWTKQKFDLRAFFTDLGEAIRILKLSQVTCLHTVLPTEALHNLNVSSELLRFRTFTMGNSEKCLSKNSSCIAVQTCFGADVSHYSASTGRHQVLIPPYEVFSVGSGPRNCPGCSVIRKLEGHMDCVYDADSDSLQSISANPPDAFWLLFIILCMICAPLAMPLIVTKLLICHKRSCCSNKEESSSYVEKQPVRPSKESNPLQ